MNNNIQEDDEMLYYFETIDGFCWVNKNKFIELEKNDEELINKLSSFVKPIQSGVVAVVLLTSISFSSPQIVSAADKNTRNRIVEVDNIKENNKLAKTNKKAVGRRISDPAVPKNFKDLSYDDKVKCLADLRNKEKKKVEGLQKSRIKLGKLPIKVNAHTLLLKEYATDPKMKLMNYKIIQPFPKKNNIQSLFFKGIIIKFLLGNYEYLAIKTPNFGIRKTIKKIFKKIPKLFFIEKNNNGERDYTNYKLNEQDDQSKSKKTILQKSFKIVGNLTIIITVSYIVYFLVDYIILKNIRIISFLRNELILTQNELNLTRNELYAIRFEAESFRSYIGNYLLKLGDVHRIIGHMRSLYKGTNIEAYLGELEEILKLIFAIESLDDGLHKDFHKLTKSQLKERLIDVFATGMRIVNRYDKIVGRKDSTLINQLSKASKGNKTFSE